jgi:hypothetical protein
MLRRPPKIQRKSSCLLDGAWKFRLLDVEWFSRCA